jgi:hypothetical protein
MAKPVELTDAEKAARILHEDRVSPNVERINKQLLGKLWALYYARDYALGVLQLLESMRLLRDPEAEREAEERRVGLLRVFGPGETPREKGYKKLCYAAADALPPSFREAVEALKDVRTDEELQVAEAPSLLDVHAWRHGGSSEGALAIARVRKLASDTYKRKTISRQDLLDALMPPAGGEAK